jgi:hypothetical protein
MPRLVAALALAGLAGGCSAAGAVSPPHAPAQTPADAPAAATVTPASAIDRLASVARLRYAIESHGATARRKLHRVGSDPVLRSALARGELAAARSYVRRQFNAVWYGWHVSRVRILRGSSALIDVGVPFVVAPSQMRMPGGYTLQISIQDEIGFVKFTYRNDHAWAVVRDRGPAHVRTLLPVAAHARLPARGKVTLAGRRYVVRSFHETALGGEPVTVWILLAV